jgi:DNA-binding MarR family transcriptional regulator
MSNPESSDSDSPTRAITHLVRDTCLCLHVQRAARALARRFDEVFRPLDLTHGQFSLLMSLNRPEPPRIGSVAELLAMDRTTLTANLKPLERRRLVNVVVDKNDKRSRRLMLTGAGRAVLTKALPLWKKAHAATERSLASSPDDFRATLRALSDPPASQTATVTNQKL